MSYWTTRSSEVDREYIVIRHYLKGINGKIHGITFRDSYGVVEKDSKAHAALKRMPVMKNAVEKPLVFLKELKFITRTRDIENVYGKEIYTKFIQALKAEAEAAELAKKQEEERQAQKRLEEIKKKEELEQKLKEAQVQEEAEKVEEIVSNMPQITKCSFVTPAGKPCKIDKYEFSPSGYCKTHILKDPKFEELGIKVPMAMTKSERRKFKKTLYSKLEKLKKEGKF